jgi:CDP-4-dehydro-6-deoxyglucose reductase, E1
MKIDLVKNTISNEEIDSLQKWLGTYPKLTQGELVKQFEDEFSKWQGRKYSVFVSSGSSANLILAYYYRIHGLKNLKVVIPALSWATTLAPWIQFGFKPFLCEVDKDTLGLDLQYLEDLLKYQSPSIVFAANILGFPNKYTEIKALCEKYGAILLEDSCETMGTTLNGVKCGNFGEASTFSTYFAHTISTIEGGIISTDSELIYENLKMLRAHGWSRDISPGYSEHLKTTFNVDDYNNKFTFYFPGFNVRNTEIAAFLGLSQLKRIDEFCKVRERNFKLYQENIINEEWKINPVGENISNFAYPIITSKREKLVENLNKNQIDSRPLVAGNLANHPVWEGYGTNKVELDFANRIHKNGLYLPNNHEMTEEEVLYVCEKVNEVLS